MTPIRNCQTAMKTTASGSRNSWNSSRVTALLLLAGWMGSLAEGRCGTVPLEILGETKLSSVPGLNFSSTAVGLAGDTLLAQTNVYGRDGTSWTRNDTLTVNDPETSSPSILAGALDASRQTIVLGAGNGGGGTGAAYVFNRDVNGWNAGGILGPATTVAGERFGLAVVVEGDLIVVGAPHPFMATPDGPGSAYVFQRQGANWVQIRRLVAADGAAGDKFGTQVAISGDRIVVGAPDDSNAVGSGAGAVYVFERDMGGAGNWGQSAKLIPPNSTGAFFPNAGRSLAIAGDTIAIGSNVAGFIYRRQPMEPGNWRETRSSRRAPVPSRWKRLPWP